VPGAKELEWLPSAQQNLENQLAYIGERNPPAAARIAEAVDEAAMRLIEFPNSGRPGRVRGTRELVISGTPLLLVYRVERGRVVVQRLLHGAQRWPPR
jgi:toxin ParE1/3/4